MRRTTTSTYDKLSRWRRVIWSCRADRGPLVFRYYLLNTRWLGIYLHHLMTSDEDRAPHDHPWSFVTILLSSGYWEWIPWKLAIETGCPPTSGQAFPMVSVWRRRFSILYRPATYIHRLELERPTWTLVIRFNRDKRRWGFWLPRGWVHWREYGQDFCD